MTDNTILSHSIKELDKKITISFDIKKNTIDTGGIYGLLRKEN